MNERHFYLNLVFSTFTGQLAPLGSANTHTHSRDLFIVQTFYHTRMRSANIFGHVCRLCVSLCPAPALTFESLDAETSFLVCRYIFRISRSVLYIKVIGTRSRSQDPNRTFEYLNYKLHFVGKQAYIFKISG